MAGKVVVATRARAGLTRVRACAARGCLGGCCGRPNTKSPSGNGSGATRAGSCASVSTAMGSTRISASVTPAEEGRARVRVPRGAVRRAALATAAKRRALEAAKRRALERGQSVTTTVVHCRWALSRAQSRASPESRSTWALNSEGTQTSSMRLHCRTNSGWNLRRQRRAQRAP